MKSRPVVRGRARREATVVLLFWPFQLWKIWLASTARWGGVVRHILFRGTNRGDYCLLIFKNYGRELRSSYISLMFSNKRDDLCLKIRHLNVTAHMHMFCSFIMMLPVFVWTSGYLSALFKPSNEKRPFFERTVFSFRVILPLQDSEFAVDEITLTNHRRSVDDSIVPVLTVLKTVLYCIEDEYVEDEHRWRN